MSSTFHCLGRFVSVLRLYFVARVGFQVSQVYLSALRIAGPSLLLLYDHQTVNSLIDSDLSFHAEIFKYILQRSCESVIPLLGLATIISVISKYLHRFWLYFLSIDDNESASSTGSLAGVLFLIMALQCSLTSLPADERYWRLLRNFVVIGLISLESLHKPVSAKLQSLSASRSTSIDKHARALLVSAITILIPLWFLTHLWLNMPLNTWKITVTIFSVEIIFKMSVTLITYTIGMLNSFYDISWNGVDDHLFLLKASCGIVSYICAISLFINGTWVLIFEQSTLLKALSLCVHLYFNLWNQACKGWKSLNKRRLASTKITQLKDATKEELFSLGDVCSICFQNLDQAKVTKCSHYFHAHCLTRWLYLQDTCPLCFGQLFEVPQSSAIKEHDT